MVPSAAVQVLLTAAITATVLANKALLGATSLLLALVAKGTVLLRLHLGPPPRRLLNMRMAGKLQNVGVITSLAALVKSWRV